MHSATPAPAQRSERWLSYRTRQHGHFIIIDIQSPVFLVLVVVSAPHSRQWFPTKTPSFPWKHPWANLNHILGRQSSSDQLNWGWGAKGIGPQDATLLEASAWAMPPKHWKKIIKRQFHLLQTSFLWVKLTYFLRQGGLICSQDKVNIPALHGLSGRNTRRQCHLHHREER